MTMVKVSIGVPVYNVEAYLRECLDSIMNQTFKDFEVIMVDDGSTDNSFDICQEYVARDRTNSLIYAIKRLICRNLKIGPMSRMLI